MATSSSSSSSSSSSTSALTSKISGSSSNLLGKGVEIIASGVDILATELADELAEERDEDYEAFEAAAQSQAEALYAQEFGGDQRLVKAALIPRTGESAPTIRFMFNPTDLQFSRSVTIENVKGARTFRGLPKVNFGFIEPYELKLSGLIFDTYETGEDVYELISPLRDAVDFSSFQDPFEEKTITDENGNTYTYSERTTATNVTNVLLDSAASAAASTLGSSMGVSANVNMAGFMEYGTDLDTQALELRRPPVYYFIWGEHNYMRCMIKDLSFKLTMFLPNGRPVRAMVDLSLQEVDLGAASHALSERSKIIDVSASS
ncbi:MAG: hypothetical protein AAGH78_14400 [Cyanobacteria bacterium P01_H01_bin.58]